MKEGVPMEENRFLEDQDPELFVLINHEKDRQRRCIELIASENFTSKAVMQCLGSCLTNKYSEGLPGRRYYGGNEYIDQIEILCQKRALKAFHLDPDVWGVNVQPYSGSPANFAAYTALLKPHDRIMGMDLSSGGHLTHGFYTAKKRVSATSIFFESLPYKVNPKTGWLDYDKILEVARAFRPKLIIAGVSAYPRNLDYKKFRKIADEVGAFLLADMAHVSGLVAAKAVNDPFEFCHVVTSTSHKSLRGPRTGMIFYNKILVEDAENRINEAVFPGLQGGPHNHQIAALACQLEEVASASWKNYAIRVLDNAQALCNYLISQNYSIVTGGTDTHLILWDLSPLGLTGSKLQEVCDACSITLNKNAIPGDQSALSPSGVRIGSPAMTSRGLTEADFVRIGQFLHKAVQVCQAITEQYGKQLVDFRRGIPNNPEIKTLRQHVQSWVAKFPLPGFDDL